ncbi:MAG: hypothetical protein ACTJLM_05235 [Ehrlichia sp.]
MNSQDEFIMLMRDGIDSIQYAGLINNVADPVAVFQYKPLSGLPIIERAFFRW